MSNLRGEDGCETGDSISFVGDCGNRSNTFVVERGRPSNLVGDGARSMSFAGEGEWSKGFTGD